MIEEKNVAFRDAFPSRSLISSNCSVTFCPLPNAWTTFWFSTISSIRPVCSPRISDCSRNMEKVLLAIKFATRKETGVISTTTNVIITFTDNMKQKVPTIVAIPVKSWVKPIRRPSAN